jgi:hypothetical protein
MNMKNNKHNSREKANPNQPNSGWVLVETPPQVKPLTPEWAALKFLQDWTPSDIELAIKKNVEIDLSPFWAYVESLVIQNLLEWFKLHRPDLHAALATEDGVKWLKRNLAKMTRI